MVAFKNIGHIVAFSAFVAFITIQISPLWAKLDYSKTEIPCPIHAMQARQAALYAEHQKRSHEKYTELASYLGQGEHTPHHNPDMICLPGMDAHSAPPHDADHDHSHEPNDEQQNSLWACPYCAVKEMAFMPSQDTAFSAPHLQTAAVRYFSFTSEPAKISAARLYHARAPPALS